MKTRTTPNKHKEFKNTSFALVLWHQQMKRTWFIKQITPSRRMWPEMNSIKTTPTVALLSWNATTMTFYDKQILLTIENLLGRRNLRGSRQLLSCEALPSGRRKRGTTLKYSLWMQIGKKIIFTGFSFQFQCNYQVKGIIFSPLQTF